jgi:hypothetical protein
MTAKSKYGLVLIAVILAAGIAGFVVWRKPASPVKQLPEAAVSPPAPPPATPPVSDCLLPGPAPVPPDGGSARDADMKLGHDVIQAFVVSLEAYQACRNAEIAHAGAGISEKQKQSWIDDGNAAIDQANALAAAFSAQLKIFKAHNPGH